MGNFSGNPYTDDKLEDGSFYRTFDKFVSEDELIWHRDKLDRKVKVIHGNGWKLQFEDGLPIVLLKDSIIKIPAYYYHRLIKGQGDLVLRIFEER